MKYISKNINTIQEGGTYGNEADFVLKILETFDQIFGDRLTITQPVGEEYYTQNIPFTSASTTYIATLTIDNKFSINLRPRTGTSSINSFSLNVPIINSNYNSIDFINSSYSFSTTTVNRNWQIKVIEDLNILIIQIGSFSATNTGRSYTIICLKNDNIYSISQASLDYRFPNFSQYFTTGRVFTEIASLNTASGTTFTLPIRLNYNRNINDNNEIEIISNKIALRTGDNTNTIYTTFSNLTDCSYVPENIFFTMNEEQYLSLNNYTLLKINDGFNIVDTLVETSSTPSEPEP